MAVLKLLKASSLMETLVATVLLIVVFMIASLTVNKLLSHTITHDTHAINQQFYELEYKHRHRKLILPYTETYKDWNLFVFDSSEEGIMHITFKAIHNQTHKMITKTIIPYAQNP